MSAAPPAGVVLTPDDIAAERAARAARSAAAAPARARDATRRAEAKEAREVKELVNTGGQDARSGTHNMQHPDGKWYTRVQMARIKRQGKWHKSAQTLKKEQMAEHVRELRARDTPEVHAGAVENPHVGVNLGQGRKKGKSRPTMVGSGPIMRTAEYRPRMWPRLGLPDPIGMSGQSGGARQAKTLDGMPIHVPAVLNW